MTFGAQEVLLDVLAVVEVGEATGQHGHEDGTLLHKVAILIAQTLKHVSCQHFYIIIIYNFTNAILYN
jgi:hypothetical protein